MKKFSSVNLLLFPLYLLSLSLSLLLSPRPIEASSAPTSNFIFISVDDLRGELGGLGYSYMKTPAFDRIFQNSVTFRRAYVQFPVCGPSRTSMLTGRRPDTTHVTDLVTYFRAAGCNVTTMPQFFKKRGYYVAGSGKIFHPRQSSGQGFYPNNAADDPPSWSVPFNVPEGGIYRAISKTWWSGNPEEEHPDYKTADYIIDKMQFAKNAKKPFFLMAGFEKPHLPFVMPTSYLNKYPPEDVSMPDNYDAPGNFPGVAYNAGGMGEMLMYSDIKALNVTNSVNTRFPRQKVLDLRRAYRACVSFVDAQIGRILDAMNNLGLQGTTTIVLWSDHGFNLGEHAAWGKHSAFETDARIPFAIRTPKYYSNAGRVSYKVVESIDIFPTLVELAGLTPPIGLQGRSLVPLLENPNDPDWNGVALTQVQRLFQGKNVMGYSIRTADWRYTEWPTWDQKTWEKSWDKIQGRELYDHRGDNGAALEAWENDNLIDIYPYSTQAKVFSDTLRAMVERFTRPEFTSCVDIDVN